MVSVLTPDSTRTETIRISNGRITEISFCLEPWGDVIAMPPGSSLEIVTTGLNEGQTEVYYEDQRIVFYGWNGSDSVIFRDGIRIGGSGFTT